MIYKPYYEYILFDFDGTLIDTNELIIEALQGTTKQFLGRTLSNDELSSILGKYLELQMKSLSEKYYKEMMAYYREYYKANQDTMIKGFPGVAEMLRELKAFGCRTAIVSAKGRGGIEHGLEYFKLNQYIDVIISAYDIENNKPHPEPATKALTALGGSSGKALMIGDSPYDIQCGHNAGMKSVLVEWSIFPKDVLLACNPDFIAESCDDIVNIVKSGN